MPPRPPVAPRPVAHDPLGSRPSSARRGRRPMLLVVARCPAFSLRLRDRAAIRRPRALASVAGGRQGKRTRSSVYEIVKYIHIVCAIVWVGGAASSQVLGVLVTRSG